MDAVYETGLHQYNQYHLDDPAIRNTAVKNFANFIRENAADYENVDFDPVLKFIPAGRSSPGLWYEHVLRFNHRYYM